MAEKASSEPARQYLTIRLGADEYGIALQAVREIVPLQGVTRVPGTPPWVRGVCNLRGTVLPVIDLGTRFGFGDTAQGKRACFLILELTVAGQMISLGVLAESVSNVIDVAESAIEAAPEVGLRLEVEYVRGLVRREDRFVVLLDATRIFECDELVEVGRISAPGSAAAPSPPLSPGRSGAPESESDGGGVTFF